MTLVLLSFFWLVREIKNILFWLYLWQLKEYHVARFIDYFRVQEGKKVLLNWLLVLKLVLAFLIFFNAPFAVFFLLFVYFLESLKFFYDLLGKKVKKPVFTMKTAIIFLIIFSFASFYLFIYYFLKRNLELRLLFFDVFTPIIVSGFVLIFQPFTVLLRQRVIEKAKRKRQDFKNLIVVGITGSYGKTATKEFLASILSEKFNVLKTEKHQNSEIGIAQCILQKLNENHQIFVVEMGAYNKGGIKLLCDMAKPEIGIIAGVNEQHMATFGSQENIIKAKFELAESLPEKGKAIINLDSVLIRDLKNGSGFPVEIKAKELFVSTKAKADIFAKDVIVSKDSIFFKACSKDNQSAIFQANLVGSQNIENILLAVCCAWQLGMSLEQIAKAFNRKVRLETGMMIKKGFNNVDVIDSTYSANPTGVISHIEHLKHWQGKKAIIMPCLIELGQSYDEVHSKIGKRIAEVCDLCVILKKQCFSKIKESALASGMKEENIVLLEKAESVAEKLKDFKQEDVILMEGRIASTIKNVILKEHGD